jgi:hypothetical protein
MQKLSDGLGSRAGGSITSKFCSVFIMLSQSENSSCVNLA